MALLVARTSSQGGGQYAGLTPDVYVSTGGGGSGASEGSPTTLSDALTNAVAGEIVGILPGVYTGADENDRWTPSFRPTNSGASGNPITFVAKYPAAYLGGTLAELRVDPGAYVAAVAAHANRSELSNGVTSWTGAAGMNGCPVIGASGVDYIRWIGPFINGATSYSHADTAPCTWSGADGCELHQSVVLGWAVDYDDNYSGIRLDGADGFVGRNNILRNFHESIAENHNTAGVLTYFAGNLNWQHNDISDTHTGMFIKSSNTPTNSLFNFGTIGYNRIRNVVQCLDLNCIDSVERLFVLRNLLYEFSESGVRLGTNVTDTFTRNISLTNNTISGTVTCIWVQGNLAAGHLIEDNIFDTDDAGSEVYTFDGRTFTNPPSNISADGNHFYREGAPRYGFDGSTHTTLSAFEAVSDWANGQEGAPDFVDAANGDFSLGVSTTAAGKGAITVGNEEIGLEANPTL